MQKVLYIANMQYKKYKYCEMTVKNDRDRNLMGNKTFLP